MNTTTGIVIHRHAEEECMSDEHPVRKAFDERRKEQARVAADLGALSFAEVVEARSLVRDALYAAVEERDRLARLADKLSYDVHELEGEVYRRIRENEDT